MKYSSLVSIAAAAAFAVAMGVAPAAAGNTKVKTKVPAASAKPKPVKAPNTSTAAKAKPPKAKPAGATKPQTSTSAAGSKSNKSTKTASKKGTDAKPAVGTNELDAAPGEPGPTVPLSKAQEKLLKNDNLRAKLAARLGRDPVVAAAGFKNLGQFVAAVNVSDNLGIEFTLLKRLMVGSQQLSLGQAIQQAKAMDAVRATRIANDAVVRANADISASSSASGKKVKVKS